MTDQLQTSKADIKTSLKSILAFLNNFYLILNQELLFWWRRFLDKQSTNTVTVFLSALINNPITALVLNTIVILLVAGLFGGFIQTILYDIAWVNVFLFLINIVVKK